VAPDALIFCAEANGEAATASIPTSANVVVLIYFSPQF
jgi:hypothetical protein